MKVWDKKDKKLCGKTLVAWLSCIMGTFVVVLVLILFYSIVVTSANEDHIKKMKARRDQYLKAKTPTDNCPHSRIVRSATEKPPAGHGIFTVDSQNPVKRFKTKVRALIDTYGAEAGKNEKKRSHIIAHDVEVESSESEPRNPNFPARFFGDQFPDYYDIPFDPTDYMYDSNEKPDFKKKQKRMVTPIPEYIMQQQKETDVTDNQGYVMNIDGNEKSNRTKRV